MQGEVNVESQLIKGEEINVNAHLAAVEGCGVVLGSPSTVYLSSTEVDVPVSIVNVSITVMRIILKY